MFYKTCWISWESVANPTPVFPIVTATIPYGVISISLIGPWGMLKVNEFIDFRYTKLSLVRVNILTLEAFEILSKVISLSYIKI